MPRPRKNPAMCGKERNIIDGRIFLFTRANCTCYPLVMETPISKSQTRAMSLLGLVSADSYEAAASALETAGYRRDGIPAGQTWRSAAKMSDTELVAAIAVPEEERRIATYGREKVEY